MTIPEQLVDIYEKEETWHRSRLTNAFDYHRSRYENGNIEVYVENGCVLGYYEFYIVGNTCFLYNVWVKESCRRGEVFRALYKKFMTTLPSNITEIVGEKVKLGGRVMTVKRR